MTKTVIRVERLGKKYHVPLAGQPGRRFRAPTFRETLTEITRRVLLANGHAEQDEAELWALRDVSFEVNPGEVVGIIGRNGAGKTTLLKILSRITEPTTGKVCIRGRVASLLEVGTGFHPELTGRENIFLNGAILGMPRAEIQRKLDEIVGFAEIEKFLDTPVKRYSSGMYVRLAFAVAAHLEPEILVIDEVLSVGDAEFQKKCLGKMNEVSEREGRTVLLVSHQMNVVERLCGRALFIDHGTLQLDSADVRSVIRTYLSPREDAAESGEWRNRGGKFKNPWFCPQRVFLADAHGNPAKMPLPVTGDIWLYVQADVETLDSALTVGYGVYAESGELLYRSYHTDAKEPEWPQLRLGRNILRSRVPPGLLNEGIYRIELIAALYYRQWIVQPGGADVSVFLHLQGGLTDSPLRGPNRSGFLAPILPWERWPTDERAGPQH